MNRNEDTANLSTDTTSAVVEPGDGADDTARLAAARERARAGNLERGRAKLDAQGKLFVRDRIDRGLADQRTYQLHAEEAYWLTATRARAPVLQWLTNYRAV